MRYAVIMAGGAGTRLWPMSRQARPKQLLAVVEGTRTLLDLAYARVRAVLPPERIFVCTAEAYRDSALAALPELPPDNLLGEPCRRDTAAAVGFPAAVLRELDPDAVAAFVSSDHVIEPENAFAAALDTAFAVAEEQAKSLVTLGVVATSAHTGMGYVERGEPLPGHQDVYGVRSFTEKPNLPTARTYLDSGRYYWNSGMFVWRCDTVLGELATHLPETYAGLVQIAAAWHTPQRAAVLEREYRTFTKISIDYAVMEPASRGEGTADVVVVELPVDWLDVGSWPALGQTLPHDPDENATAARAVLLDSRGNIVLSDDPEHLVATVGLHDMIIVHTADATLVCPRSQAQKVKDLLAAVTDRFGTVYA